MKTEKATKLLSILIVFVLIGYAGISIYRSSGTDIKTETAYIRTVSETVDAEFFIIRDEEIITSDIPGVVVSLAKNGGKISNGSEIAAVFSNETDAENYSESLSLQKKLESYEKINSQARLANLDLGKLNNAIDRNFYSMLDSVYYNNYRSLSENEISFSENFSRKSISFGDDVDSTAEIVALKDEISKLTAVQPIGVVSATRAGFYVSRPDGYESVLTSADVDSLTVEKLNEAFKAERSEIPENSVGKIINGFDWYAACVVPSESLSGVEAGHNMNLMLGDSDTETISAKLYIKQLTDDNKCLAVFKCSFMNEDLSSIRRVTGKVVVRTHTGLKIRKDAIRFKDFEVTQKDGTSETVTREGVYIKEGNLFKFNQIEEIYSNDDFVIAEDKAGFAGWLSQYDEVVYSGKELENGKVIN